METYEDLKKELVRLSSINDSLDVLAIDCFSGSDLIVLGEPRTTISHPKMPGWIKRLSQEGFIDDNHVDIYAIAKAEKMSQEGDAGKSESISITAGEHSSIIVSGRDTHQGTHWIISAWKAFAGWFGMH